MFAHVEPYMYCQHLGTRGRRCRAKSAPEAWKPLLSGFGTCMVHAKTGLYSRNDQSRRTYITTRYLVDSLKAREQKYTRGTGICAQPTTYLTVSTQNDTRIGSRYTFAHTGRATNSAALSDSLTKADTGVPGRRAPTRDANWSGTGPFASCSASSSHGTAVSQAHQTEVSNDCWHVALPSLWGRVRPECLKAQPAMVL